MNSKLLIIYYGAFIELKLNLGLRAGSDIFILKYFDKIISSGFFIFLFISLISLIFWFFCENIFIFCSLHEHILVEKSLELELFKGFGFPFIKKFFKFFYVIGISDNIFEFK